MDVEQVGLFPADVDPLNPSWDDVVQPDGGPGEPW